MATAYLPLVPTARRNPPDPANSTVVRRSDGPRILYSDVADVVEQARTLCDKAHALVASIRADVNGMRWFRVSGEIEGRRAHVWWWRGRASCSTTLLARASVIVAMGDIFTHGEHTVVASLEAPVPALLTFVRAFDAVSAIELSAR
jgi:hypothetical protein